MYSLAVNIDGFQKRRKSTAVFHVLAGCFILIGSANLAKHDQFQHLLSLLPGIIISLASIVYGFLRKRIDPSGKWNSYLRILQLVAFSKLAVSLSGSTNNWEFICMLLWAAISLLLLFSERRIFQDPHIRMNKEGILIPGIMDSHLLHWFEIQDVVIREDFITIFRESNKYLQFELNTDVSEAQRAEMHAFCTTALQNALKPSEIN